MLVEGDACTAVAAFHESLAEADIHIRLARAFGVLQRNEKSAGVWLIVAVVNSAPVLTKTVPSGATTSWRACPMLSANIVAQKPLGSVIPPPPPEHDAVALCANVCAKTRVWPS